MSRNATEPSHNKNVFRKCSDHRHPPSVDWYRANSPSTEEGIGAPLFNTVFGENPNDPKEFAQIFWDPSSLTPLITDVYLKAATEIFGFSGLNGVDLSGYSSILAYNPSTHGVSYIEIVGEPGQPGQSVPDGGMTLGLLGCALVALGVCRRKTRVLT